VTARDGFGHEAPYEGASNDWVTPRYIIDALGPFDLDPCSCSTQPWPCAAVSWCLPDHDGLMEPWSGVVWLNPPYGPYTARWVRRLVLHGDGIALIFARVETNLWQRDIFPTASAYLFPHRRVLFARPDGSLPRSSSGAPSALIAWGEECRGRLLRALTGGALSGAFFNEAVMKGVT